MILGITGHRELGGYTYPNPVYNKVYHEVSDYLEKVKPSSIVSGMALGSDQVAAIVAIRMNIPVIAAVPFVGQESRWSDRQKAAYNFILSKCAEIKIVSEGDFSVEAMHNRNKWIVDNSDEMLAIFNKTQLYGGTYQCVKYALRQKKKIFYIEPTA